MKKKLILTAIIFFSISSIQQLEAKPGVKHHHSCSQTILIQKPLVVTGYWKWSPRFRQYVWVKTFKYKKVKAKKSAIRRF
jgi:hypothetical protein